MTGYGFSQSIPKVLANVAKGATSEGKGSPAEGPLLTAERKFGSEISTF
jgi:hypothetical protein